MHGDDSKGGVAVDGAVSVDQAFAALKSALADGQLRDALVARQPLYLPGVVAGREAGFPTLADVEQALEMGVIDQEEMRIYVRREKLDLTEARIVHRGKLVPQMLQNAALMGHTFVFNNLQRQVGTAHRLALLMEEWVGDSIEVVMIASFAAMDGLKQHFDQMNLLIVQVAGAKVWTLLGDPVAPGSKQAEEGELEEKQKVTMQAGDVLFLPAGQHHVCNPEGFSVHIALLMLSVSGSTVARRLTDAMKESLPLKQPVIALLGPEQDRIMAQQYRAHLHELVDELNIERIIAQERAVQQVRKKIRLKPGKPKPAS